ncbi:hypothetical protein BLOT_004756 [Blomia tropicalis]|nr:hypothetical protein BLOT_004756 [Blomia tropicalis]
MISPTTTEIINTPRNEYSLSVEDKNLISKALLAGHNRQQLHQSICAGIGGSKLQQNTCDNNNKGSNNITGAIISNHVNGQMISSIQHNVPSEDDNGENSSEDNNGTTSQQQIVQDSQINNNVQQLRQQQLSSGKMTSSTPSSNSAKRKFIILTRLFKPWKWKRKKKSEKCLKVSHDNNWRNQIVSKRSFSYNHISIGGSYASGHSSKHYRRFVNGLVIVTNIINLQIIFTCLDESNSITFLKQRQSSLDQTNSMNYNNSSSYSSDSQPTSTNSNNQQALSNTNSSLPHENCPNNTSNNDFSNNINKIEKGIKQI